MMFASMEAERYGEGGKSEVMQAIPELLHVIMESERMWPPFPGACRQAVGEVGTDEASTTCPMKRSKGLCPGNQLWFIFHWMNRDPERFSHPESFWPGNRACNYRNCGVEHSLHLKGTGSRLSNALFSMADRWKQTTIPNDVQHYSYGYGTRHCVGIEVARQFTAQFLHCLLADFDFELKRDQSFSRKYLPVSKPVDGVRMKVCRGSH